MPLCTPGAPMDGNAPESKKNVRYPPGMWLDAAGRRRDGKHMAHDTPVLAAKICKRHFRPKANITYFIAA